MLSSSCDDRELDPARRVVLVVRSRLLATLGMTTFSVWFELVGGGFVAVGEEIVAAGFGFGHEGGEVGGFGEVGKGL